MRPDTEERRRKLEFEPILMTNTTYCKLKMYGTLKRFDLRIKI